MICKDCGRAIADDSRFCQYCGASQQVEAIQTSPSSEQPSNPPPNPVNPVGRVIGIAAAVLLVLVVIVSLMDAPKSSVTSSENQTGMDNAMMMPDNMTAPTDPAPPPAEEVAKTEVPTDPWSYSQDVDKVRGGTSWFASTTSTNSIHQDPPYDADTTMRMTVRRMPSSGTDVVLTVSSGQLMCPSYDGCSGTVRFDDGPAERISFDGPADNSSDTIFVVGAQSFIRKLKKARKVIIEKTMYEAGQPQFEFDVAGLKWDH